MTMSQSAGAADHEPLAQRDRAAEMAARDAAKHDSRRCCIGRVVGIVGFGRKIRFDRIVAVRLQHHRDDAQAKHIAQTHQRFLAHGPRIHMRARGEIEDFEHDAALIDVDARVPRRNVTTVENERIAVRAAETDDAIFDDEVGVLAIEKAEAHQDPVGRCGAPV